MKVSPETAARVLDLLDMYETPERAAHELAVGLSAISPYTDRRSTRVRRVLQSLERADSRGEGVKWRAALLNIREGRPIGAEVGS